jgi:prepilin-type N-terminal cleavage/methylation domain-containing protein
MEKGRNEMKKHTVRKVLGQSGFTVTELLIVITIMSFLLIIASQSWNSIMVKYNMETDVKTVRATFVSQQISSSNTCYVRFVTLQPNSIQTIQDTNGNGIIDPSPADTYDSPVNLRTQASSSATTFLINKNGIISDVTSSEWVPPTLIKFSPADVGAELDCILVYPTMVRVAKQNGGGSCDPR